MYGQVRFVQEVGTGSGWVSSWVYRYRQPDDGIVDPPVNMTLTAKAGRELSPDGWKAAGQLWDSTQVFEKKIDSVIKSLHPLDESAEYEFTQYPQWSAIVRKFEVTGTAPNSSC